MSDEKPPPTPAAVFSAEEKDASTKSSVLRASAATPKAASIEEQDAQVKNSVLASVPSSNSTPPHALDEQDASAKKSVLASRRRDDDDQERDEEKPVSTQSDSITNQDPPTTAMARSSEGRGVRVPGAVRIDLPSPSEQEFNTEVVSLRSYGGESGHEDGPQAANADQPSQAFLATAELVDEDLIRRQALESTVKATAELLEDKDEPEEQAKTPSRGRRCLWVIIVAVFFVVSVVIAVVVATSAAGSSSEDSTKATSADEFFTSIPTPPSTNAPTPTPSAAPTTFVLELANEGSALFGTVLSFGETPVGTIFSGGQFGHDVVVRDLVSEGQDQGSDGTLVVVTYGSPQLSSFLRRRQLKGDFEQTRKLALEQNFLQFAVYRCSSTGICNQGVGIRSVGPAEPFNLDVSQDGMVWVVVTGLRLLFADFTFYSTGYYDDDVYYNDTHGDDFYDQESLYSLDNFREIPGNGIIAAVMNFDGNYMATSGEEQIRIYRMARHFSRDEETKVMLPPGPFEIFAWGPPTENNETIMALAMNRLLVVGTNIENEGSFSLPGPNDNAYYGGYRVRMFDVDGQQIGQVIENGDEWSITSRESLAIAANGTILAIGSSHEDPGLIRADMVQVDTWRLAVNGTWTPLGSALKFPASAGRLLWDTTVSVVLSGDGTVLAVGSPGDNSFGTGAGRVSVYRLVDDEWLHLADDLSGIPGSNFGSSLSINQRGNKILVGAPESQAQGDGTGEARFYQNVPQKS